MNIPQTLQTPLTLGSVPQALHLPRGQILACTGGCLWITSDALAGRDSDIVLESGQYFVTPQAATYFVGAPRGSGILSLDAPRAYHLTSHRAVLHPEIP